MCRPPSNSIIVDGDEVRALAERDPAKLPWGELGAEIVIESTGVFTNAAKARMHIRRRGKESHHHGACQGRRHHHRDGREPRAVRPSEHTIVSNASCTTNCLAPVAKVILERFGIVKGFVTTVHSYTNDQVILDYPHKDLRRARAAALNIIPTTTGPPKQSRW